VAVTFITLDLPDAVIYGLKIWLLAGLMGLGAGYGLGRWIAPRQWEYAIGWGWLLLGLLAFALHQSPIWVRQGVALGSLSIGSLITPIWVYRVLRRHPGLAFVLIWHLGVLGLPSLYSSQSLLVPPYRDGAVHTRLLLDVFTSATIHAWHPLRNGFYHAGYHGLVAWLLWMPNVTFSPLMLHYYALFLWLFVLPISVYGWIYTQTKKPYLAAVAAWLATSAWSMPQHALNWAKYPALFGITLLPLIFATPINVRSPRSRLSLLMGIMGLFWGHIRAGVLWISWLGLEKLWHRTLKRVGAKHRFTTYVVFLLFSLTLLAYRHLPLRFYVQDLFVILPFLLLALAQPNKDEHLQRNARLLLLWLLLAAIPLPLTIRNVYPVFLLDRPFFEMSFVLPLTAILISLYLHYGPYLQRRGWANSKFMLSAGVFILGFAYLIYRSIGHIYHPQPELILLHEDDLVAQELLKRYASPSSAVLIAQFDGGEWVAYWTGLPTFYIPHHAWWQRERLTLYCREFEHVWVYVDLQPQRLQWPPPSNQDVSPFIALPSVIIYRVNCEHLLSPT